MATCESHPEWENNLDLACQQWARDPTAENFDLICQQVKRVMKLFSDCPCHANPEPNGPTYLPGNPQHVIRWAAGWFDAYSGKKEDIPLTDVETSIALWQKVSDGIPRVTFKDVINDLLPTLRLQWRMEHRYKLNKQVQYYWQLSDKTWESTILRILVEHIWEDSEKDPNYKLADVFECSWWTSEVRHDKTGNTCWVWCKLKPEKPWSLDTQRLKFLNPWPVPEDYTLRTGDHWISERSEDGDLICGGLVSGRDDDVLAYIENHSSGVSGDPCKYALQNMTEPLVITTAIYWFKKEDTTVAAGEATLINSSQTDQLATEAARTW